MHVGIVCDGSVDGGSMDGIKYVEICSMIGFDDLTDVCVLDVVVVLVGTRYT